MRSRSSVVKRFIFARLDLVSISKRLLGNISHTDFETKLGLVLNLSLLSPARAFLGVQHQDVPVWRIRSSKIEFVDV
jgi:hypothetical protein